MPRPWSSYAALVSHPSTLSHHFLSRCCREGERTWLNWPAYIDLHNVVEDLRLSQRRRVGRRVRGKVRGEGLLGCPSFCFPAWLLTYPAIVVTAFWGLPHYRSCVPRLSQQAGLQRASWMHSLRWLPKTSQVDCDKAPGMGASPLRYGCTKATAGRTMSRTLT